MGRHFARFGCKEPSANQLVQRPKVLSLLGSPGCAGSPTAAPELADYLFSLAVPCSPHRPLTHHFGYPLPLLYPSTDAATAVGTLPDVFSMTSSPNWRAFRFNALICLPFIWASYSS